MTQMIPALLGGDPVLQDPYPLYNAIGVKEKEAVLRVMESRVISDFIGRAGDKFGGGKEVLAFETMMSRTFDVRHSVSFNSATTALQAAIVAAGVGPGDEVITTPYTMSATASAILLAGAVPVFADIELDTYCLSAVSVERHVSEKTRAILVVNIFGGSARYDALLALAKQHNLIVIEDNAQAIGGTYDGKALGTIGDMGVFSFNVHKHLQCGEGGVLVTDNDDFAERAKLVRNHGEVVMDDYIRSGAPFYPIVGSNYRLSELHAAVASEQLKKMKKLNEARIALATYLTEELQKQVSCLQGTFILPHSEHVYYVYPMQYTREILGISRKTFAAAMKAEGFPLNEGYVTPLHLMPVYQEKKMYPRTRFPFVSTEFPSNVSYEKGICPVAELCHDETFVFTTICHYPRTKKDIDMFIAAIQKIEASKDALQVYESEQNV